MNPEILSWAKKHLSEGGTYESIKDLMTRTGYQQNEIDQVYKEVSDGTDNSAKQPDQIDTNSSPYKKIIITAIILMLTALTSFGLYYYYKNSALTGPTKNYDKTNRIVVDESIQTGTTTETVTLTTNSSSTKSYNTTGTLKKCGDLTVTDKDGNLYNTILIGTQCWMKQNMRVGKTVSIKKESNIGFSYEISKYCYEDKESNCTTKHPNQPDGGLYPIHMAQRICPSGWHLPTDQEFYILETYLDPTVSKLTEKITEDNLWRGTTLGGELKFNGDSGFEANYAGIGNGGGFQENSRDEGVGFWTSTEDTANPDNFWYRMLYSKSNGVRRESSASVFAMSVRCIQD